MEREDISSVIDVSTDSPSAINRWLRACEKRAIKRNIERIAIFLS
jgi:hypothetical protein